MAYDSALADGMGDEQAAQYADEHVGDYYGSLVDRAESILEVR
jgi:hypothetical protein